MGINGAHVLLYTPAADDLRTVLSDVIGWGNVDAGGGWLIFSLPPAEIAVHPAERTAHELSLMCDDLTATREELEAKGIDFVGESGDEGWGVVATMRLPGGLEMLLYEPRHPTAI